MRNLLYNITISGMWIHMTGHLICYCLRMNDLSSCDWTHRTTILILHFVRTGTCACQRHSAIHPFAKPLIVSRVTGGSSLSQYTLVERQTLDRPSVWAGKYRQTTTYSHTHIVLELSTVSHSPQHQIQFAQLTWNCRCSNLSCFWAPLGVLIHVDQVEGQRSFLTLDTVVEKTMSPKGPF